MIQSDTNTLISLDEITTNYHYANSTEELKILEHVLDHTKSVKKTPSREQWNDAWQEISQCDSPRYFKPRFSIDDYGVYRYKQKFIKSKYPNLESDFHDLLLNKLQDTLLNDIDCVVEFGCGTGHNLSKIRNRNPNTSVYGSDWTNSSQDILSKSNIPSWNFDMLNPSILPEDVSKHKSVCFLTVGSMEQLGDRWQAFFQFMTKHKPKLSLHIEPIFEFYDSTNPHDQLAINYHNHRGYLKGFAKHALTLNMSVLCSRTTFGNTYNEGFSVLGLKYE